MPRWLLLLIPLMVVPLVMAEAASAQVVPDTTALPEPEELLEDFADDETEQDPTEILELLEDLRTDPLDINRATAGELALVPAFSPLVAANIVRFRESFGPFGSIPELRAVEGITEEVFLEARPYLTIGEELPVTAPTPSLYPRVPALSDIRRDARLEVLQRFNRRLDLGRGYDAIPDSILNDPEARIPTRYQGSPERIYTRLRATYRRNLSLNLTLEKDPGEPFQWDPGQGFYGYDFVSFHAAAMQLGRIDALVLGDFAAEFGQGLVFWRPSGFGKSREAVRPVVRKGRGIRPYGSTDENRFFRGAAATVALTPQIYVTALASRHRVDATVFEIDTTDVEGLPPGSSVTSLGRTGLHRTPSEIERKNALGQTVLGGAIEARLSRLTLGVAGHRTTFDAPLAEGERPYQRFNFAGREATMAGAYANVFLDRFQLFGEMAVAPGGAVGAIAGAEAALDRLDALVLARHYPRDFNSLHGYAFGERNGVTQNESGLYLGLRLRPAATWTLSGYFDLYRFPWVRFNVPRPSTGYEALLYVEHRPRRWITVYAQGRTETRDASAAFETPTGATLPGLVPETRQTLRLQGEYVASNALRFRARVEGSRFWLGQDAKDTGVLLFQDVRWQPRRAVQLDARLTFFEAEAYGARLFQFENDLYGVFQNTLLYGKGARAYAMLTFRPGGRFEGLDLRLKLAQTRFQNRRSVGSGLDEVEGDRVRDLALQLRYRL